jgi:predicted ATPase/DNA-binding CsgD family transcriptional regulator
VPTKVRTWDLDDCSTERLDRPPPEDDSVTDLRDELPPVALPVELDSFVGRRDEIARCLDLLAGHRLVTLVGPGGVGKTRLALRIAHRMAADGLGGVFATLSDLPAEDMPAVRARLLRVLRVPDNGDDAAADAALADRLRRMDMLLVVDNCEHQIGAVRELLLTLLAEAPGVRVLATSRTHLGLPGEQLVPVSTLAARGPDGRVPDYPADAVRLLVDRAAARGVVIDPGDPDAVRLVRAVEGLPLAVELAAAHLDLRDLPDIADDLDRTSTALGPVKLAAQDHHVSLPALMDWSYRLLTPHQQRMWAILAEFRGTFPPSAAVNLCARLGIAADEAADLLAQLLHSSILSRTRYRGSIRVWMLAPVRDYGLALEPDTLTRAAIQDAHADYVTNRLAQGAVEWYSSAELDWLHGLTEQGASIAAAVRHLVGRAETVPQALTTVTNLGRIRAPIFSGAVREVRSLVGAALEAQARLRPGEHTPVQVVALGLGAWLAYIQGQPEGPVLLDQARALHAVVGGPAPEALVGTEATALWLTGGPAQTGAAVAMLDHAVEMAAADGFHGDAAMAALFAALAAAFGGLPGSVDRARAHLADTERVGAEWAKSWAGFALAVALHVQGDIRQAAGVLRRVLRDQYAMGDTWGLTWSVWLAGAVGACIGETVTAARLLGAARRMRRSIGTEIAGLEPWLRVQTAATALCVKELGPAVYDRHVADGAALPTGQAVELALGVVDGLADTTPAPHPAAGSLTPREREVADLAARGLSDSEIGAALGLSPKTVENHLAAARKKLGDLRNRTELTALWVAQADQG